MFTYELFGDANFWLDIVYSSHLLDSYYSIRIDRFTKIDGDRLNWFDTTVSFTDLGKLNLVAVCYF